MAILLDSKRDTFDVILRMDTALDVTDEQFDLYRKDLDESHLKFHPGMQPTRFVMRKILPFAIAKKVQNEQLGSSLDGRPSVQLSFMSEEVKAALVDIKNPQDLPEESWLKYEKDKSGTTSEALMELLIAAGLVMELYTARQAKMALVADHLKKK